MKRILSVLLGLALVLTISYRAAGQETAPQEKVPDAVKKEQLAVERFLTLLKKTPRQGTSLDRVYGFYVDSGQLDDFVTSCREATEKSPDDAKAFLLLGLVLARRGDDAGAIAALKKAEELDPADPMASFYLGQVLVPAGQLKEAGEALERSLKRKPGRTDLFGVLQLLGRVYERFGDKAKSNGIWKTLEENFPDDLDIQSRIAETLEEENRLDEALVRYEKLAERSKKDNYARVRFTLSASDILIRLGRKKEAIDRFEKLLTELSGDSWLADSIRDRVERVFVRQADYAGLVDYYRKRLVDKPNDLETIRRLAVALVRLSRLAEARELLVKTLEKAPNDVKLRLALIDILVHDKDFDEAGKQYEILDKNEPNHPDHLTQWGLAVLENKKIDEETRKANAAAIWKRLVAAREKDPAMIVMVADLLANAKIDDEAENLYLKAVELVPNDPSYREFLGYFYHRRQEKDKAIAVLKQTAEGDRRSADSLSQLANIFRGLGYAEESRDALKQAVELAPNDFNLKIRYGEMLVERKQLDDAKRQLADAEKLVRSDDERESFGQQEINVYEASGELEQIADSLEAKAATPLDFWKLAILRRALGESSSAGTAIEKALVEKPESLLVLRTAADLYGRNYDYEKAAAIYEKLASVDAAHRVDYLKRLATTQNDLGLTDKALETARLVMAVGAGNAANSKFYADMLLNVGKRDDGIEALRRAVRLDPTDKSLLGALAETLASGNDFDEAIELYWRIFERTEDLQGKMAVVAKMSQHYQSARRFDQLVERLRQRSKDTASRRESAYCLAQAFASVQDFVGARKSLESLLTDLDGEKTSDTFLLSQLSKIAEDQKDLGSAVRYQEMLCDLTDDAKDRDRLLFLYYENNQKEKSQDLYVRNVMEKTELADQLDSLDTLLAREDYATARTVLDRLDAKNPGNWEILYRNMLHSLWTKEKAKTDQLAETLRSLSLNEEKLSAAKQRDKDKADASPTRPTRRTSMTSIYGSGYSPWQFPQTNQNAYALSLAMATRLASSTGNETEEASWTRKNTEILQTIFRDKLELEQYYYQRGNVGTALPPKPLFKPENVGDAKFAALALLGTENIDELKKETDDRLRLRLDMFLKSTAQTVQKKKADEATGLLTDTEVDQSKRRLGQSGKDAWQGTLFDLYLADVIRPYTLKEVDEKGIDRVYGLKQYAQLGVDAAQIDTMRKQFEEQVETMRKAETAAKNDTTPIDKKIAWILDYIEKKIMTSEGGNDTGFLIQYPLFVQFLKEKGRDADVARLEAVIEKAGKERPGVFLTLAQYSPQRGANRRVYFYVVQNDEEEDDNVPSEKRFGEMKKWLLKAKDGFLRQKGKPAAASGLSMFGVFNSLAPETVGYLINTDIQADRALLLKNLEPDAKKILNEGQSGPRRVTRIVGGVQVFSSSGSVPEYSGKTITLSDAEWNAMLEFEKRIYRDIDLFFDVCRDLNKLRPPKRPTVRRAAAATPSIMSNAEYLFSGNQQLDSNVLMQYFNVQGKSPFFDAGVGEAVIQQLTQLDRLTKIDPNRKDKADFRNRFDEFLDEKSKSEDEFVRTMIGDYKANRALSEVLQSGDMKKIQAMVAEEVDAARKAGKNPPENFEILLAVFDCRDGGYEKALQALDALQTSSAADIKTKELLILTLFQRQMGAKDSKTVKERAGKAADTLLALQLSDRELQKLQQVLMLLGRKDDAKAIRERLLATATELYLQYQLLNDLQNDESSAKNDQVIAFALRVLRSPAVSAQASGRQDGNIAEHVRRNALDILKKAQKLDEILGQLEAQYESSPDSIDLMYQLTEVYHRAGRKDDCRKIIDKLAKTIPDDADKQSAFGNLLSQVGMEKEAVEWNAKALAAKPELLFNRFWEHENKYRQAKKTGELIEILKKMKPEIMQRNYYQVADRIPQWMRENDTKTAAKELLDKLWNLEGISGTQRQQFRMNMVRNMHDSKTPELYPYLHEAIFASASPPKKDEPSSNLSGMVQYADGSNPFSVQSWSSDKFYFAADTLIGLAEAAKKLDELEKEVKENVASYKPNEKEKSLPEWFVFGKLLEAFIELRKKNPDTALAIVKELRADESAEKTLASCGTVLGQELGKIENPEAVKLAIEFYEKTIAGDRQSGPGEEYIMPRLLLLYLKSEDPEKGRQRAIESLVANFSRIKMMGDQDYVQIGNRHYSKHSSLESTWKLIEALSNNSDFAMDTLLVYREHCDGQAWFADMLKGRNFEYYSQQLQTRIDGLLDKIDVDSFVKNIDKLLPVKRSEENSPVGIELGVFCRAVLPSVRDGATSNETLVCSLLQGALEKIKTENPAKYVELKKKVADLLEKNPDAPGVLIADAFFKFLDENVDAKRDAVIRCANWVKKSLDDDKGKDKIFPEQILLGCWIVARDGFSQKLPDLNGPLSELTRFSCRLIDQRSALEKSRQNRSRSSRVVNPSESLQADIRSFAPKDIADENLKVVETVSIKSALLRDHGRVVEDLKYRFYAIRDKFVASVTSGNHEGVLDVFKIYYVDNKQSPNYEQAYLTLFIFDAVIDALPKNTASYERLRDIVLPLKVKYNHLFSYNDLGGRNGTFRTPIIPLADFAIAAGKLDDLKARIAKLRKESDSKNSKQFDVVERIVALKTKDWEKFKTIKVDDPMLALVSVSPILNDPEAAKQIAEKIALDEILDTVLPKHADQPKFSRFAHHVIEQRILPVLDSGDLARAVRWATIYRKITESQKVPNGFRFMLDEKLEKAALVSDDLDAAVAVLKYFSDEIHDSFRYRNLDALVKRLEENKASFGNLDVSKIQRKPLTEKNAAAGKPTVEKAPGLAALPTGTIVYENDFETEVGNNWSVDRRDITPVGKRTYLGEFFNNDVEFNLDGLPEHKFLRVRFDLFALQGLDGLVGVTSSFGEDVWTLTEGENRRLIATTLSNFNRDPNAQKQSYPEDFPLEFGRKPDWNAEFENDDLWGDQLRPGYSWGRTGAVEENNFGIEKNAVYAVDLVFSHDKAKLVLKFTTRFKDGPYEIGKLRLCEGECWGLDNFRVETLDGPLTLSDAEFEACWKALLADEPIAANAARSRLAAAGDAAVAFFEKKTTEKTKEFANQTNLPGFRIFRVLDLIDSAASRELKRKVFDSDRPSSH